MILYKYVSHEIGMKILEGNSISFTKPKFFNDPFETEAAYYSYLNKDQAERSVRIQLDGVKKQIIKNEYGVLSLTRQPLNPLMWSHYADEHKGMVIGIDVSDTGFTSEEKNTIPVQYGNVIYTETKPGHSFLGGSKTAFKISATFEFQADNLERLQRTFLYKPSCWSYEEEVRVVKCLKDIDEQSAIQSGSFQTITVDDNEGEKIPIHLFELPTGAVREVYFGVRSSAYDTDKIMPLISRIRSHQPMIRFYGCKISDVSWTLSSFDIEAVAKKLIDTLKRT